MAEPWTPVSFSLMGAGGCSILVSRCWQAGRGELPVNPSSSSRGKWSSLRILFPCKTARENAQRWEGPAGTGRAGPPAYIPLAKASPPVKNQHWGSCLRIQTQTGRTILRWCPCQQEMMCNVCVLQPPRECENTLSSKVPKGQGI